MNALLLSAGYGSRLRPITLNTPKCLVEINGKPLLSIWLNFLENHIDIVIINTHYLPEKIENFIRNSNWQNNVNLVFEEKLLGTAGTILKNRQFFDKSFLVAHADNLTKFNLEEFKKKHELRSPGIEITMMTFETDDPKSCGIVEVNEFGIVTAFYEKINTFNGNTANAAVYIMEPTIINFIESLNKEFIDISVDIIPRFIGKIQVFKNNIYHRDIGTPLSLKQAFEEFRFE